MHGALFDATHLFIVIETGDFNFIPSLICVEKASFRLFVVRTRVAAFLGCETIGFWLFTLDDFHLLLIRVW